MHSNSNRASKNDSWMFGFDAFMVEIKAEVDIFAAFVKISFSFLVFLHLFKWINSVNPVLTFPGTKIKVK